MIPWQSVAGDIAVTLAGAAAGLVVALLIVLAMTWRARR